MVRLVSLRAFIPPGGGEYKLAFTCGMAQRVSFGSRDRNAELYITTARCNGRRLLSPIHGYKLVRTPVFGRGTEHEIVVGSTSPQATMNITLQSYIGGVFDVVAIVHEQEDRGRLGTRSLSVMIDGNGRQGQ